MSEWRESEEVSFLLLKYNHQQKLNLIRKRYTNRFLRRVPAQHGLGKGGRQDRGAFVFAYGGEDKVNEQIQDRAGVREQQRHGLRHRESI